MLIDFENLRRAFRGVPGDAARLPQQWGMPPEKDGQHSKRQQEPHRQPNQCAAEGFFGAAAIAQGAQKKGEEETDQAVTEIEGHALERKYRCPSARFDQGVQIVGEEKPDRDDQGAQGEGEDYPHQVQRSASPARAVRVRAAIQAKFPPGEPLCTIRRATGETRKPSAPSPAQIKP